MTRTANTLKAQCTLVLFIVSICGVPWMPVEAMRFRELRFPYVPTPYILAWSHCLQMLRICAVAHFTQMVDL